MEKERGKHALPKVLLLAVLVYGLIIPIDGGILWDKDVWRDWGWVMAHYPLDYLYLPNGPTLSPDHLPGDMILYKLVQVIYSALGFTSFEYSYTIAYKIFSVGAVFMVALLLLRFLRLWSVKHSPAIVAAALLFNPIFILDSAWWGQWDAVSLSVALAAIISMARPIPHIWLYGAGVVWAAWACSMKPQLIILLLPVAIVSLVRLIKAKGWLKSLGVSLLGTVGGVGLIALICSIFGLTLLGSYSLQSVLESIQHIHWNLAPGAPTNIWWSLGADKIPAEQDFLGIPLTALGNLMIVVVLGVLAWFGRKHKLTLERALLALTIIFFTYYTFSFIMHERYLIPAFAPWSLWAVVNGTRKAWASYWLGGVLVGIAALGVVERWGLADGLHHDFLYILTALASYLLLIPLAMLVRSWLKPNAEKAQGPTAEVLQ